MGGWLIGLLISWALKLGLSWLVKKFPWLPPGVVELLEELIKKRRDPRLSPDEKRQAEVEARQKIRQMCSGSNCVP